MSPEKFRLLQEAASRLHDDVRGVLVMAPSADGAFVNWQVYIAYNGSEPSNAFQGSSPESLEIAFELCYAQVLTKLFDTQTKAVQKVRERDEFLAKMRSVP